MEPFSVSIQTVGKGDKIRFKDDAGEGVVLVVDDNVRQPNGRYWVHGLGLIWEFKPNEDVKLLNPS